jgi:hypothetical protein
MLEVRVLADFGDASAPSSTGTLWMALAKSTTAVGVGGQVLHELPGGVLLVAGAGDPDDGAGDVALAVLVGHVVGHGNGATPKFTWRVGRSCRPPLAVDRHRTWPVMNGFLAPNSSPNVERYFSSLS